MKESLSPDGRVAFDVLHPDLRWLSRDPNKRWAKTTFKHPVSGRRYIYTTNTAYDPVTQIAYVRIYYMEADTTPAREHVIHLAHRQFFPAELHDLVERSGFRVTARFGGFAGEPFGEDSESQVLECTPVPGPSQ